MTDREPFADSGTARGASWAERLRAVESRNVTYIGGVSPLFWTSAEGCVVEDVHGRRFLDLTSGLGPAFAGHRHPDVVAAVVAQANRLLHGMGDVHPPTVRVELLERLTALAPWADARGILATSGSEAVEIALKTAQLHTGRAGVIAFDRGYHGLTLGALAATARAHFRAPFEARIHQGVEFMPFPLVEADSRGALLAAERALRTGSVGAVLVEPIQGRGGVRIPARGFLRALEDLTRRHGALLVFDEILTGIGRTGRLFALEHEEVVPDLICAGKALGGGLPIGVCLGPREVIDGWPLSEGEAIHTSTFLGHPLSCAASIAVLEAMEREDWIERAAEIGCDLLSALREALDGRPGVREVRGRGLLIGIELQNPDGSPWAGGGAAVADRALELGVIVLPAGDLGEVLELAPPVVLDSEQLREGVTAVAGALGDAWRAAYGGVGG